MADKINQKIDELRHKRDEIRLGGGLKSKRQFVNLVAELLETE